eukprot:224167-Prymnesium_polylepis.1
MLTGTRIGASRVGGSRMCVKSEGGVGWKYVSGRSRVTQSYRKPCRASWFCTSSKHRATLSNWEW